jgi:hypothetical protein
VRLTLGHIRLPFLLLERFRLRFRQVAVDVWRIVRKPLLLLFRGAALLFPERVWSGFWFTGYIVHAFGLFSDGESSSGALLAGLSIDWVIYRPVPSSACFLIFDITSFLSYEISAFVRFQESYRLWVWWILSSFEMISAFVFRSSTSRILGFRRGLLSLECLLFHFRCGRFWL